jgi:hypothetical protein
MADISWYIYTLMWYHDFTKELLAPRGAAASNGEAPASAETELFASLGPSKGKHLGGAEKDMFFLLNETVKLSN